MWLLREIGLTRRKRVGQISIYAEHFDQELRSARWRFAFSYSLNRKRTSRACRVAMNTNKNGLGLLPWDPKANLTPFFGYACNSKVSRYRPEQLPIPPAKTCELGAYLQLRLHTLS